MKATARGQRHPCRGVAAAAARTPPEILTAHSHSHPHPAIRDAPAREGERREEAPGWEGQEEVREEEYQSSDSKGMEFFLIVFFSHFF